MRLCCHCESLPLSLWLETQCEMFAKLSALVSSGPTFPYTLGEAYSTAWGAWTHFRGKAKEDGAPVSIFKISAASKNDPKLQSARNGVKRLKTVCSLKSAG